MKTVAQLIRIKHWIKNLFLFAAPFFGGRLFEKEIFLDSILGFLAFGFIASSIYIINDYKDLESDRIHPIKRKRPLASGEISIPKAGIIFTCCLLLGISVSMLLDIKFAVLLGTYFILNLAYSLGLKHISILDIFIISIGFVLRVKSGGVINEIYVTEWLLIMVFLLSLFIALAKRRDDLLLKISDGLDIRASVKNYNLEFITSSLTMISGIIIVSYLLYTLSGDLKEVIGSDKLFYTCIFVLAGMMRFNQIIYVENKSGSPTDILYKDKFIITTVLGWILTYFILIYEKNIFSILKSLS